MYKTIQKVKTQYSSNAQGEFSQGRTLIFSASDWSYAPTALTSADLVGGGLTCWSHSFSISRRQLSGTPPQRVSIAVRCSGLSDSMVPMFIHLLLTGSKILSIVGRVGGLSDMVLAAEAALGEPCAFSPDPPPSIRIIIYCNDYVQSPNYKSADRWGNYE